MVTTSNPAPTAPLVRAKRFPCFDGLRAVAAVSVLVFHTAGNSGFEWTSGYGLYTSRLILGVSVFFLISGFLLYRPFAVSHFSGRPSLSPGRFWFRRLLRIVPAYWVVLTVITYVLHAVKIGVGWQSVVVDYGFSQIYFPAHVFTGIEQAWTLCTEMSFYLFLPLFAALIGARKRSQAGQLRRELIALAGLVVIGVFFKLWVLTYHCVPNCTTNPPLVRYMITWLPSYFDLFALGMFLAVMSAWYTERASEPKFLSHALMPWISWGCAAVTFVVVSHVGDPLKGELAPGPEMVTRALYGVIAFFLLLPAVFGPQHQSAVRRLLSAWPVAAVGVISYGVYLWHVAWMTEVFRWAGVRGWSSAPSFVIFTVLVFALSVAAAAASYLVVERPLLRLKDGIGWTDVWRLRHVHKPAPRDPSPPVEQFVISDEATSR